MRHEDVAATKTIPCRRVTHVKKGKQLEGWLHPNSGMVRHIGGCRTVMR